LPGKDPQPIYLVTEIHVLLLEAVRAAFGAGKFARWNGGWLRYGTLELRRPAVQELGFLFVP
jgi:hypothetical protein